MSDSIKVAVRIRPLIQREKLTDCKVAWTSSQQTIQQKNGSGKYSSPYTFDRVFGMDQNTDDVFEEMALPILEGAMLGFNGTVFAYGQTSSGKTYTMLGTKDNPGIIPRVIEGIFNSIENNPEREYLIRVSYLEIYNENVTDLLSGGKKPLDVREDTEGNVFVANLHEELVTQMPQIMQLMEQGQASRHVGATNMNEYSSRSHTIFRIIIESRLRDVEGAVMVSQLNLVDLAGSEKAKATGATGQRLTEGGFINKSLFILGNVISQLSDGVSFVSYRDSRLTRILQNSLGGNSKTVVICNISPVVIEETHSSLRFATNAKRIKNKPVQNEVVSDAAMLQRYKKEISKLQAELNKTRSQNAPVAIIEENQSLKQQMAEKEHLRKVQEEKIDRLEKLICVSSRIKSSTPDVRSFEARKRRRETWCPGKAGLFVPPKVPAFGAGLDVCFPERKFPKSLSNLEEISGSEEEDSPVALTPISTFKDSDRELTVNMSTFSNEDMGIAEKGSQTEVIEEDTDVAMTSDESALRRQDEVIKGLKQQLEESQTQVTTLLKTFDENLAGEGKVTSELKLEIHRLEEELTEALNEKKSLEESIALLKTPTLANELADAEDNNMLATKLETLEEENKSLTEKLRASEGEIQGLLEKLESANEKPNLGDELSAAMENQNISEKLEAAEQKIQELLEKLSAAEQDNIVIMESQALALSQGPHTDDNVSNENHRLMEEKLMAAEADILQLKEKLTASEVENKTLAEELATLKNAAPKLGVGRPSIAGLDLVQSQLDALRMEIQEKNETINELEQKNEALHDMSVEILDESNTLKNQKILIEEERDRIIEDRDRLHTQVQDMQLYIEKRETEFKETEEFLTFERDLKNDSIMAKDIGEDMLERMKKQIVSLEQALKDSQTMLMDTNKAVSSSKTEMDDMKKALVEAIATAEQLSNEKSDFSMYQELEKDKHKRREAELTAQLEEAYQENAELRAAAGGNLGNGNLEASLRMAENPQVEELQAEVKEMTVKMEESGETISNLQEELMSILAAKHQAELKLASLKEELETSHRQQLDDAQTENEKLCKEMETLSAELEDVKKSLEEANNNEAFEKLKEEYEAYSKEAEDKVELIGEELKKTVLAQDELIEEHAARVKELKKKSEEELQEKILAIRDEAMKKLEEATASMCQKSESDSKLLEERDEAIAKCEELAGQLENLQQLLKDLTETSEKQILQLVQERDEAVGHREMLMEQCKELSNAQPSKPQQQNTDELELLATKVKEHEDTIERLTAEGAERLTINEQLNAEMELLRKETQDTIKRLTAEGAERLTINEQLNAEMELLRKEAQSRGSVAVSEEEFETMSMKVMDLEDLVTSLTEERDSAKEKIETLEENIKALQKQVDEAESTSKDTSVVQSQDSEEMLELKTKIATYEGQVEQLEECIQEQFTELNTAKEEAKTMQHQKESLEAAADERLKVLLETQAERDFLRQSLEELKEVQAQKESAEQVVDEVQKVLIESQSNAQQIQEKQEALIRSLEEERDTAKKEVEDLGRKIKNLQREIEVLREPAESTDASELQVQVAMYKDQIDSLNACMAEQQEEFDKERDAVESVKEKLSKTEEERDELVQRLESIHEDMEILKKGTEEIVNNLKEERDTAMNMAQQLHEEMEKYVDAKDESSTNKETIVAQQEEIESLEATIKQVQKERDDLHDIVDQVDKEIEKVKTETEQIKTDSESKVAEVEEQLKERTSNHEREVEKLGVRIGELENMCEALTGERDKLRNLCDEMDEELCTKEDTWKCEKKDFENKMNVLEKSVTTDNSSELEQLRTRNQNLEEWYKLGMEERDRVRNICDEMDDEMTAKEEKWEKEKKELEKKLTDLINKTEDLTSKLKGLEERNGVLEACYKSALSERDDARRLCDEVDDELTEKEEKWEKEVADFKKRITELKGKATNSGDAEKMKKLENDNLHLKMRANELENKVLRDPLSGKIKELKEENKLLMERVASQRNEIRRYQNQVSEASFIQGRPGDKGPRSASCGEGIVGSVKVLTLEAEKAALERELKQVNNKVTRFQQQHKDLLTKNKEQEQVIEKLRKYYKKSFKDLDAGDHQVLRGIANAMSPAVRASPSPWSLSTPASHGGHSKPTSSLAASEDPDQCTTQ